MLRVEQVTALPEHKLYIEFNDGQKGIVDVTPFMESAFFNHLRDPNYFSQVSVFFCGIGWPNGQDLSPDTLEAHLQPFSKTAGIF